MAGAVAVVVFDNVDGPLIPMAKKAEDNDVNVPSVFVSKESGEVLETLLNDPKHGKTVVVTLESPSEFGDWPNAATSACVTFGALCVLLSVVLVLKRREQAQLAAAAAARPPETRLLSAEEVAAVAKTAVFSSQERVLSFLRGSCGGACAGEDGEDDKLVVDNGTGATCAVCIEDYESGDELRALDCGHAFHKDCIDPWLITKRACCPVCKHVIAPPPPPTNATRRDSRRRRRSRWSVLSNASLPTDASGAASADESDLEAPLLPAASSPARSLRRGLSAWFGTRGSAAGRPDAPRDSDAEDDAVDEFDPRGGCRRRRRIDGGGRGRAGGRGLGGWRGAGGWRGWNGRGGVTRANLGATRSRDDRRRGFKRSLYLLIGPLENAKLTSRVWSSMLDPFAPSIAAWASFFVSYSISAYPLTNPVRRSRLRCMFRISP